MSHFTVTVALPGHLDTDKLSDALTEALAPFDENKGVPRYVKYTKAELIAEGRKEIEDYKNGLYAEYLADPVAYAEGVHNDRHLAYLAGTEEDGGFPAKLTWTDEQVYADQTRLRYEPGDIGPDGEVYSTRNPKSQWDWWSIGGRWGGAWTLKDDAESALRTEPSAFGMADDANKPRATDCARIGDIAAESLRAAFAFIDLDGEWHGRAKIWTPRSDEPSAWDEEYREFIVGLDKDVWVVNVDAHI